MKVFDDPDRMRSFSRQRRAAGARLGFVPTMGFLHEGHLTLMRRSAAECDVTVASIYVNPLQFGPTEDFDAYPRDFERDRQLAEGAGVDCIFTTTDSTMYPPDHATYVHVEGLTEHLCGASRPRFFRGVTTVVTKLFHIVDPDVAYFGQKDAQQAAVVRRMTADLDLAIEIVVCPIVREHDGLAMSSRNAYLSASERADALCLRRALDVAERLVAGGERHARAVASAMRSLIDEVPSARVDYTEVVDASTIRPVERISGQTLIALAVWIGKTRLIDNTIVSV